MVPVDHPGKERKQTPAVRKCVRCCPNRICIPLLRLFHTYIPRSTCNAFRSPEEAGEGGRESRDVRLSKRRGHTSADPSVHYVFSPFFSFVVYCCCLFPLLFFCLAVSHRSGCKTLLRAYNTPQTQTSEPPACMQQRLYRRGALVLQVFHSRRFFEECVVLGRDSRVSLRGTKQVQLVVG